MSITPATFKTRFPEFASEDDARVQLFLDDAVVILNEPYWGAKYDLGQSYLAAHYLALANQTASGENPEGTAGPITGRSVDGTSVSFAGGAAAKNQAEAYYMQTSYGQRYLALVKSLGIAASVV